MNILLHVAPHIDRMTEGGMLLRSGGLKKYTSAPSCAIGSSNV